MQNNFRLIPGLLFSACILFTAACYWSGLKGPLLFDDIPHLLPLVNGEFSGSNWDEFLLNKSGPLKRPVAMASFIANAFLHGNDIWWWKFTNLVIHLLTGVAIFYFTLLLVAADRQAVNREAWWISMIVAGIWLAHPLHVSTVLYTVQRMTQLSGLFTLLAMIAYTAGRTRQIQGRHGTPHLIAAFCLFLPLGMFSKENALLLFVYCLLLELLLLGFYSRSTDFLAGKRLACLLLIPVGAGMALLLLFFDEMVLSKYVIREFSLAERLLTEARVMVRYLGMILLPRREALGLLHDDIAVSAGLLQPQTTLLSLLVIILLLGLAWWIRQTQKLASFGILFFFSAHLLESTVFPLELAFEHRNYLASFGVMLAAVALLWRIPVPEYTKRLAGLGIILALLPLTYLRSDDWSSGGKLIDAIYEVHPESRRIRAARADRLSKAGRFEQARALLSVRHGVGEFFQRLNIDCRQEKAVNDILWEGRPAFSTRILDMYAINEIRKFSLAGLARECRFSRDRFLALLEEILAYPMVDKFEGHKLFVFKAHYLWQEGRNEEAYDSLEEAARLVPDDPVPLYLAAEWSARTGDIPRAEEYITRAMNRSDFNRELHAKLAAGVRQLIVDQSGKQ